MPTVYSPEESNKAREVLESGLCRFQRFLSRRAAVNISPPPSKILGSWKEIAAYLGKGVRTAQRWEHLYGLPVRRPVGASQGVVYATPEELDAWLAKQWQHRSAEQKRESFAGFTTGEKPHVTEVSLGETPSLVQMSQELRQANRELLASLRQTVANVKQECASLALLVPAPERPAKVRYQEARQQVVA